jgi:hypothetical protein
MREKEAKRNWMSLKAANDNLVSETTALRDQLKGANDNIARNAAAIHDLRRALDDRGWRRAR